MRNNVCIFHGRFQPFHIGHLSVLEYIAKNTGDDILIGIINPNPHKLFPGDGKDWIRFDPKKNPLSFWERYYCIYLSIKHSKWYDRVLGIIPLPRPSINIKQAECYMPEKPRSFTICEGIIKDEVEDWKKEQYIKNEEQIFTIPIKTFPPLCQLASGELIRYLIVLGNPKWKDFVPKPALNYLIEEKLDTKIAQHITKEEACKEIKNILKGKGFSNILLREFFPEYFGNDNNKERIRKSVFIGSTSFDLKDLRHELAETLKNWGYLPVWNESPDFPKKHGLHSHDICLDAVKESDIYLLIIDRRYGGTYAGKKYPKENISITWYETKIAIKENKEIFSFVRDEIWNERPTYKKNLSKEVSIEPHHVDDPRVFDFIDFIVHLPRDNWIYTFKNSLELKEKLKSILKMSLEKKE